MSDLKQTIEMKVWMRDAHGVRQHEFLKLAVSNCVDHGSDFMIELSTSAVFKHDDRLKVWITRGDLEDALRRLGPQR